MDLGSFDLGDLLPFIAIGFTAQVIDGAIGMAFGLIANTLLVGMLGVSPAQASARVHLVKIATGAVSGASHLINGNVDSRLFIRLLVPGLIGGVAGAYLLTSIDGAVIKPYVLTYLAALGVWLLVRGLLYSSEMLRPRIVEPLGLLSGFLDSIGGGGWGPIVTSSLLVQGAEPRKAVGTVNSAEFLIAAAISATFISQLGWFDIVGATLGLLIGGTLAAPLGAIVAKRLSPRAMLILVGSALLLASAWALVQLATGLPKHWDIAAR